VLPLCACSKKGGAAKVSALTLIDNSVKATFVDTLELSYCEVTTEQRGTWEPIKKATNGYFAMTTKGGHDIGYAYMIEEYIYDEEEQGRGVYQMTEEEREEFKEKAWYLDGYTYNKNGFEIWVEKEEEETEDKSEYYKELGVDFEKLEQLEPIIKDNGGGKYTITVTGQDLTPVFGGIIDEFKDLEITFSDLVVDVYIKSSFLKTLEYNFSFTIEDIVCTLSIKLEVLSVNKDIIIPEMPAEGLYWIEMFKQEPPNAKDIFLVSEANELYGLTDYGKTLENIVIPKTVNGRPVLYLIGTFYNNGKVQNVTIPDSVEEINHITFYSYPTSGNLLNVNIPASVKFMYSDSFVGYPNATITFEGLVPPVIDNYSGWGRNGEPHAVKKIRVPAAAYDEYLKVFSGGLANYAEIIEAY
jgi:hypothetical protein